MLRFWKGVNSLTAFLLLVIFSMLYPVWNRTSPRKRYGEGALAMAGVAVLLASYRRPVLTQHVPTCACCSTSRETPTPAIA